eukprot:6222913-Prymnesium_polylepis.1
MTRSALPTGLVGNRPASDALPGSRPPRDPSSEPPLRGSYTGAVVPGLAAPFMLVGSTQAVLGVSDVRPQRSGRDELVSSTPPPDI